MGRPKHRLALHDFGTTFGPSSLGPLRSPIAVSSAGVAEFDITPFVDPAAAWIGNHPHEIARHAGRHLAVHPTRGIVATGATLLETFDAVRQLGLSDEDETAILFDIAPGTAD